MWSERAKDLTRKCASDAGMGNPKSIKVITEPEAAAIYELMRRVETQEFSIDDTFVLCDAGGGTVDLISYTVKELQPPRVEEATSGSGGSCGSTFINRVFAKWLKSHLGDSPAWDDDVLFAAVDEFEQKVKKNFDPKKGHRDYMIRLPYFKDLPEKNIQKGKLGISTSQMKSFFEPVIIEVISLVRDQISRTQGRAKSVILVGGFGQSIYLKDRLQEAVQDGVRVVRGLNPVSAVVTGAAIYGVQESTPQIHVNSIESRKSRHHYGVEALVDYNSTIHESDKKFKDDFTGNLQVRAMNWIIHKVYTETTFAAMLIFL
ncbi:hypothetical protein PV04_07213 [Neofusicoccum parvum]|nr:hypothetical protein PV04_07213 [Neofusicoccum parvum]